MSKVNTSPKHIYQKKEMVLDCRRTDGDVIVFDINLYNVWGHDKIGRRVANEFPEFMKEILRLTVNDQLFIGECIVMDVRGYTLVGLITHLNPVDAALDDNETVAYHTMKAIDDMVEKLGENRHFVSGILGRRFQAWDEVYKHIMMSHLKWSVYTE